MNSAKRLQILKDLGIKVWSARANKTEKTPTKPTKWDLLEQSTKNCRACDLANSRTNVVFGAGNRQARLMVIGEAPGKEEDIKGKPFVGSAGKLLDAMLKAIGFDRSTVFIANILKCRPPNNRDPDLSEINQCVDFLHQQIALVKPDAILCVGRIAAQSLLRSNLAVGRLREQMHKYKTLDIPLIVTYHPAYLLRKPSEKVKTWEDLKQVFNLLKSSA